MSEQKRINRRRFLALLGGSIGATALACGGLAVFGTRRPAAEFAESSCGGEVMKEKILVTYASKCGSTGEVAEAIGEVLCTGGAAVDVRPIRGVGDVSPYRAVVVGSAVRFGRWLPEAVQFVERHGQDLGQVPTAFFTMHILALGDSEDSQRRRASYLDAVHRIRTPDAEAFFAGKCDPTKLSFVERLMAGMVKSPEGDLRDWQAIRAWAGSLWPALLG